jgi:NAD(P)-dependent dehydrogenase (short-subunit alcohol dehydrogenase family)
MELNLTNKTVLLTGASGGIGGRIALQFAQSGARLALHYYSNPEAVKQLQDKLSGDGHQSFRSDLRDPSEAASLCRAVIAAFGKIDILINNAGVYQHHPLENSTYEDWQKAWNKTLMTNLFGPANLIYCVAREMIKASGGKIINVSSRGAFRGEPEAPAYGASKAGLNAMSQSLAQALAPHNIFVYVVAPGFVDTAMARPHMTGKRRAAVIQQSPLGRVADPDEVARTILFLAADGTDFLTGSIVDINGASYLRS